MNSLLYYIIAHMLYKNALKITTISLFIYEVITGIAYIISIPFMPLWLQIVCIIDYTTTITIPITICLVDLIIKGKSNMLKLILYLYMLIILFNLCILTNFPIYLLDNSHSMIFAIMITTLIIYNFSTAYIIIRILIKFDKIIQMTEDNTDSALIQQEEL